MSATIADPSLPTAQQPMLHPDNILAHPGSTFAGIGMIALQVGQAMTAGAMPTTTAGWVAWGIPVALGVLGTLGK